jgi:hypothetical protein
MVHRFGTTERVWFLSNNAHSQHTHSIRYYKITFFPPTRFLLSLDSIPVSRETGRLTNTEAYLHERRVSLALFSKYRNRFPCFTILYLADDQCDFYNPLRPIPGHFASMHLFIDIIVHAIDISCKFWEIVLTELDTELSATVRAQLAPETSAIAVLEH